MPLLLHSCLKEPPWSAYGLCNFTGFLPDPNTVVTLLSFLRLPKQVALCFLFSLALSNDVSGIVCPKEILSVFSWA